MIFHTRDLPNGLHKSIDPNLLPQVVKGKLTDEEYIDRSIVENLLLKDDYYKSELPIISC